MGFKTKNGVLLKYEEAGTLERLGIRKKGENLSIPKSISEIADEAFTMTSVSSVFVPPTVHSIGEKAFALCAELENIELSLGLQQVGPNAFDGCRILRSISLPDTCQSIGIWAFCNCSALNDITLSNRLEAIERGTFSGCTRLTEIRIPESVHHIDARAFYNCTALENVTLSSGLRTIGREAFAGCSALKIISIPETVTEICEDAFAGCTELKTVIIPPSVTKLHPYAFGSNPALRIITTVTGSVAYQYGREHNIMCYTEKEASLLRGCNPSFFIEYGILRKYSQEYNVRDLMIPEGVLRIGNHAFEQNKQLVSAVIPEGVIEIGDYAFNGCRNLSRIYFPSTLKRIGKFAFRDCPILEAILPQGMEAIEKNAFQSCTNMRRFYMPDTVTVFEPEVLRDCMSITELRFSPKLEAIADGVCSGCSSLRTVVIPEGPKYIQQNAFRGCSSLREAYIPDSVLEISGNAFAETQLFRMTGGHYIVGRFLIRSDGYSPIPKGVHRIGPRAFERGGLRAAIIPDGVISIGDNAFANCGVLTDVTIPKSVTEIGVDAFAYTPWLMRRTEQYTVAGANILLHANTQQPDIDVPLGIRCIGPAAFAQLPLRSVRLPEGLVRLQHGSFSFCEQLESIEFPSTLREVDGYVFHNCTSLSNVTFREGLTKIGHAMFSSCNSLRSVRLPSTLTEIDNEAFYHAGIERIIIPDGVTRIGQSAFSHCDNLTDIAIPPSVTEIADNAFTECPKFRLHAEEGSFAERYVKQNPGLMTFVPLNSDGFSSSEVTAPQPTASRMAPPVPKRKVEAAPQPNDPSFLFEPQKPVESPKPPVAPVEEKMTKAEFEKALENRVQQQQRPVSVLGKVSAGMTPPMPEKSEPVKEIKVATPPPMLKEQLPEPPKPVVPEPERKAKSDIQSDIKPPVKPASSEAPKRVKDLFNEPIKLGPKKTAKKEAPTPPPATPAAAPAATPAPAQVAEAPKKPALPKSDIMEAAPPVPASKRKYRTFDEDEELNYAMRVKRELEEARKKSVPVDPNATLPPPIEEPISESEPVAEPAPQKEKKQKKQPAEKPQKPPKQPKESKEDAKARRRAALLDDLPDLPDMEAEEREMRRRQKESPEETKARRRAALLDDLPDLPDEPAPRADKPSHGEDSAAQSSGEPNIPKLDAGKPGTLPDADKATDEDPFANIQWNEEQSTFTIRF